ncbi:MAG: hypothetical protein QOF48_3816 [Verrucomicrobiota bacterium]|jgi:hypothetical protein
MGEAQIPLQSPGLLSPPCPVTAEQKRLLSPSLSSISEMEERVPEGRERRSIPPDGRYGAQSAHNGPGDLSSISEMEERVPEGRERRWRATINQHCPTPCRWVTAR